MRMLRWISGNIRKDWNIGIWNEEIPIKIETTIDKRERERELWFGSVQRVRLIHQWGRVN